MSTPDQRHQEKMAARAECRAPVIAHPVAFPKGASVDERYQAKLAHRVALRSAPKATEAKGDNKPEGAPPVDAELAALEEATRPDPKSDKPKATEAKGDKPAAK